MLQLILHLFGDYVTQSDWMAQNKTKESYPALIHSLIYGVPFAMLAFYAPHPDLAMCIIIGSHFFIDRYGLARYLVFAKNYFLSPRQSWKVLGIQKAWIVCRKTGYPMEEPGWLFVWLLIVVDNTLHLAINYVALKWA
jgi:hypothetical protein